MLQDTGKTYFGVCQSCAYAISCTQQLAAVKHRAARFVKGEYTITSSKSQMLDNLGWQMLQHHRQEAKLLVYSIKHGLVDIPASPVNCKHQKTHPEVYGTLLPD